MSDAIDLTETLKAWPYDPEKDARIVRAKDGREVLQVRTPLGIEQMEIDGRPDGARPHGMESALEFYLMLLETAKVAGEESDFHLTPRVCAELFNEGTLYYFRYVRLFQLRDWTRTIRDTKRNLRAFDFVYEYAEREEDQQFLERWRPYILRIYHSAGALLELDKPSFEKALRLTNQAIQEIEDLGEMDDDTFRFEKERSLTALRELADQIEKNRPLSELEKLHKQLQKAVDRQEFERAAELRDKIKGMKAIER